MKGAQQVIKVLAVTFAVFLVCVMATALIGAGKLAGYVFGDFSGGGGNNNAEWSEVEMADRWDFSELVIEVKATSVRIEQGEEFQVVADEEVIGFRRVGDKVYIEEKDFGFFGDWHKVGGELRVVLPKNMGNLRKVEIDAGAGTVYAEGVVAEEIDLELGAGRTEFVGLVATNRAKINGGAGYLIVREAELRDLDLDMGVGKVEISGKIEGDSRVDAGVGKLEMTLRGEQDDYKVKVNKGLGSVTVNGANMGDDSVWGSGRNTVRVDGGVGAIEIRVEEG